MTATTLLLAANVSSAAKSSKVSIELSQYRQIQCHGPLISADTVQPGDCIVYRLNVVNNSMRAIQNVRITSLIPHATRLKQPLINLATGQAISIAITPEDSGAKSLSATLLTLSAGEQNPVTLEYSVRVLTK